MTINEGFMKKEPIAIIGMGCRFPGGANSPEAFWQLLRDGDDAITEVPPERWHLPTFYDPDPMEPGKMYSRWGGFVEGIEQFDAKFFRIARREAASMDPQQRMLLEVAWEALEDAGQVPERLAGSNVGVFIGASSGDYGELQFGASERERLNAYSIMAAAARCVMANRVSYLFDFRGPSFVVDTACSSSLLAVHLGCCSLWNGESSLVLAGGVNALFKPEISVGFSRGFFLAADGRCKSFDARADGYVRSEGAGLVVLKAYKQALADGDPIVALISGSATNHDGHSRDFTVPNHQALQAVIRAAYRQAGLPPEEVQYIETQGTGTSVGDLVEAQAIGAVVGANRAAGNDCLIGAVKSNIGHLESAAGISSLIKAVLALQHRQIPPNLHFETPNPKIPFKTLRLRVPQRLESWPISPSGIRYTSVNSFGAGGANVHVVLQEAPEGGSAEKPVADCAKDIRNQRGMADGGSRMDENDGCYLFPLSARTPQALQAFAQTYLDFLKNQSAELLLSDICYTATVRRTHHAHRVAYVVRSKDELAEQLAAFLAGNAPPVNSTPFRQPTEARLTQGTSNERLTALAERYIQGEALDFQALYPASSLVSLKPRCVRLPSYPWQRKRYWHMRVEAPTISKKSSTTEQETKALPALSPSPIQTKIQAAPVSERQALLIDHVRQQLAQMMDLAPSEIDREQGFFEMGMQSLQAIELSNSLNRSLGLSLDATAAFKYPTIEALATYLAQEMLKTQTGTPMGPLVAQSDPDKSNLTGEQQKITLSELTHLSERDAAALLMSNLERLGY